MPEAMHRKPSASLHGLALITTLTSATHLPNGDLSTVTGTRLCIV